MLKSNVTNAGMEKALAVSKSRKKKTKKNDHDEPIVGALSKKGLLETGRNDGKTNIMPKTNEIKVPENSWKV